MDHIKIRVNLKETDEDVYLTLKELKNEGRVIWENADNGLYLTVDRNGAVIGIKKDDTITTEKEDIISEFLKNRNELLETASSGFEPIDEPTRTDDPYPYDPEKIRVDTKPMSVKQIYELIKDGDIDLSPDFQRHFVWKEISKQSRLIESLLLRIPLPAFYFHQNNEGQYQVVDGVQRLTVIRRFIDNEFALKSLEYLKECEGRFFNRKDLSESKNLHKKYVRRIEGTTLFFNIIDPQTPLNVKYDLFKRINEGGKPLKPQEIRNCMAKDSVRKFLNELINSDEFKTATNNSINAMRMEDQEIALRFIAFYYDRILRTGDNYSGDMESFLDKTLERLSKENVNVILEIKEAFKRAMNNVYYLFGEYAFRKCLTKDIQEPSKKPPLNKLLFITWTISLANIDTAELKSSNHYGCLVETHAAELDNDQEYLKRLSISTNDKANVDYAYKKADEIIKKYLRR
ncbi:protein of unknown function DUF262 [Candidatus Magnetoovum chiemensis]|nr:protein of unknown function DUF262 [Candidatus Magnetoovum chiemensis]